MILGTPRQPKPPSSWPLVAAALVALALAGVLTYRAEIDGLAPGADGGAASVSAGPAGGSAGGSP